MIFAAERMLIRCTKSETVIQTAVFTGTIQTPKHRHIIGEHGPILPGIVSPSVVGVITG